MRLALAPRGLRARIVLAFAVGALLVSLILVVTTFALARTYLLEQRERSLTQQAYAHANLLRGLLSRSGSRLGDVLEELVRSGGNRVVVHDGTGWYSSSLDVGAHDVPPALREIVSSGEAGTVRTGSVLGPRLIVGVPVASARLEFYEVTDLLELQRALHTLVAVLAAGAVTATAAGALFGVWASRRVVQPLEQVTTAATRIAGGELGARLPETEDPDLVAIVGSFNSMLDALGARIERDARFVGDVSHELRSPLTSLVTSVEVMAARRNELSPRSQEALVIVQGELSRFHRMLDDLLELARADVIDYPSQRPEVSMSQLVGEVLDRSDRRDLLIGGGAVETLVLGDKLRLERAVTNLVENADRHGGGLERVCVERAGEAVVVSVDDRGPGVPAADRERVFERFVRGPRAGRGSLPGAGLGLAIVAETAARHGGGAWCTDAPGGGARFVLSLPAVR